MTGPIQNYLYHKCGTPFKRGIGMNQPVIKQLEDFKEGDFIRGKFAVRSKETPREYKNKPGKKCKTDS